MLHLGMYEKRRRPSSEIARYRLLLKELRRRLGVWSRLEDLGVVVEDPLTIYVAPEAKVGPGTIIRANTVIKGQSVVGSSCELGPNTIITDSVIGDESRVIASVVEGAVLGARVHVGPYSHIRPGSHLEDDVRIGNYAEVKNSHLGQGTMVNHFSYVGDAHVGRGVNIGAGTVTCNFDGKEKHKTIIGDGAFIGSGTMLVAPVRVGKGAVTGAGSVVTRDVADGAVVVGVPARPLRGGGPEQKGGR